jgi:hypothetical protein
VNNSVEILALHPCGSTNIETAQLLELLLDLLWLVDGSSQKPAQVRTGPAFSKNGTSHAAEHFWAGGDCKVANIPRAEPGGFF